MTLSDGFITRLALTTRYIANSRWEYGATDPQPISVSYSVATDPKVLSQAGSDTAVLTELAIFGVTRNNRANYVEQMGLRVSQMYCARF